MSRVPHMQSGSSALAALVLVAIFAIVIASARLTFPQSDEQAASALAAVSGSAAQISCQPGVVDPGMTIGIAFGCANTDTSTGSGFSTEGMLWGVATSVVPLTAREGTMTFGIACNRSGVTARSTCAVEVRKPLALITVRQKPDGNAIAWITHGMRDCSLESSNPDLVATYDGTMHLSGALQLPQVADDTSLTLRCTTLAGTTRDAIALVRGTI